MLRQKLLFNLPEPIVEPQFAYLTNKLCRELRCFIWVRLAGKEFDGKDLKAVHKEVRQKIKEKGIQEDKIHGASIVVWNSFRDNYRFKEVIERRYVMGEETSTQCIECRRFIFHDEIARKDDIYEPDTCINCKSNLDLYKLQHLAKVI